MSNNRKCTQYADLQNILFLFLYSCLLMICSLGFSLSIGYDRNVYIFGDIIKILGNEYKNITIPTQIPFLHNIKMIDVGYYHIISLDYEGYVYSLGSNENGQLGFKKENISNKIYIPQKIETLPMINHISCGKNYTMCLSIENTIWTFGCYSSNKRIYIPEEIPDICNIQDIVCGGDFTICKNFDNKFYKWGTISGYKMDDYPTLCDNWPDNIISIKCGSGHCLLLDSYGIVYSFGRNGSGELGYPLKGNNNKIVLNPTKIETLPEIKTISCGYFHSLCIDYDNNLWVFGSDSCGQLGIGNSTYTPKLSPITNVKGLSSSGNYTIVKTKDNKIYGSGVNIKSQIGIKSINYQRKPIRVLLDNEDIWEVEERKSRAKSARK